ncbi:hypothetical protein GCM10027429_28430 [Marivirga atlantica]|jgi:hypothetical protein|uniref:Carboxypeptidase-like regulatory domain-containing protein n=1 Tax=Marivirga atlantica TaxID=1548457 RepID=A0A937ADQ6_9BACT|nr:carboxypeptidase-like regulatory domain-containing protein [Marivirga atlantica]MBL0767156.1 carboxypeptidase-like regulatory domain-containing protein [Marivirga atlantica]
MRNIFILFVLSLLFVNSVYSQEDKSLQISGVVLDAESLEPIPFTSILIRDKSMGTVADNSGYFSFLAQPGDTITFRSVGYQQRIFVIPTSLSSKSYSLIELMIRENVLLDEVVVYPLPDFDEMASTMLKRELTPYQQKQIVSFKRDLDQLLEEQTRKNEEYYDQIRYAKFYNMTGIIPPNNFLNPMTWSNFIRDWKKNNDD